MSAAEFAEWRLEYDENPWGEWRSDLQAGIIASTVANRHRSLQEKPYKAADFMPHFGEDATQQPQTPAEIAAIISMWAQA